MFIGVFPYHGITFGVQMRDKCGNKIKYSNAYSDILIQSHLYKSTRRTRIHDNGCQSLESFQHKLSDTPQSHKHWPAKLLDGANINDSVVKVVHKLWHVLVQEPLVRMHRVTYR